MENCDAFSMKRTIFTFLFGEAKNDTRFEYCLVHVSEFRFGTFRLGRAARKEDKINEVG